MGEQEELRLFDSSDSGKSHKYRGVLRRLAAVAAPVARDAGSVIEQEALLGAARDVCRVFFDEEAAGGLTRSEIFARTGWGDDRRAMFESRFGVFESLELLRPILDKAHQQRYVLNPFGMAGVLMFDRAAQHGGVDELLVLLSRTKDELERGLVSRDLLSERLDTLRGLLGVWAQDVARLVTTGTIAELIEERGFHDDTRLYEEVRTLNDHVTDRYPDLDAAATRLLEAALHYVSCVEDLIARVLDEGGQRRDFSLLDPEEYLTASIEANPALLAEVVDGTVFDPPSPWVDASSVITALEAYAPRTRPHRRPPTPPDVGDDDPLERIEALAAAELRRRELAAESLLQGADQTDLTGTLRGQSWAASARMLSDLLALDVERTAPFRVAFGDSLLVDSEAQLTYLAPSTLHAQRAERSAATEPDQVTEPAVSS